MDSHWNTVPRILVVFKCQNSSLDYFDTVNKLIEKKMEESITTKLLMNARISNQTIQDFGQTRWGSTSSMLRIGQLTNGYLFWQKVGDKTRFQYCVNPNYPHRFLYLRAIQGQSGSTIARQCTVTRRFYRVCSSRRKRKRIEVNSESWFDSRRSQSQYRQTGCVLHCWSQARIAPYKNTWKHFQDSIFGAIWISLNWEDCNFIKQDQTQLFSTIHCLQSSLRKRHAWRPRISFIKGKRDSKTAVCS